MTLFGHFVANGPFVVRGPPSDGLFAYNQRCMGWIPNLWNKDCQLGTLALGQGTESEKPPHSF